MDKPTALSPGDLDALATDCPNWNTTGDRLQRSFKFEDFTEAIAFIVRVGFLAEQLGHHPELKNVYNTVDITLRTHDIGNKISELDVRLAKAIDGVYSDGNPA